MIEFKLPNLGEGMESGTVVGVLVKPGDVLEADQAVLEIEADKATVELPCPHAGAVTAIHVKEGDQVSTGDPVLTLDADLQDDPAMIPDFVERIDAGADLVSGWKKRRNDPLGKTFPSKVFNWMVRKLSGIPLRDFNCGFKAYRIECIRELSVYGGFLAQVGAELSLGLSYEWQQSASRVFDSTHELLPFASWDPWPDWTVSAYGDVGLSEGAPDYGGGLRLGRRFRL